MSTVAVLGSGIVGTAAAWDLARRGHDVVVADTDGQAAAAAASRAFGRSQVVDASDIAAVTDLLHGVELVVSGLPYRFGVPIAAAAITAGAHYLDFGGNPTIVRTQLEQDDAARRAGVSVVPDCGLAPGFANVLASAVVARLAEPIDEVRIRVGALPTRPSGVLGYQLAFNPAGLINEYAEPCDVLRAGVPTTVEPLTEVEDIDWPGFGRLEAFHTAGGSSSLPERWAGRVSELDYKTLRYPGHVEPFRAMLEIGLFDETEFPRSGVAPRDVLLETLDTNLPRGDDDVVLIRVWGRSGDVAVGYQVVDRNMDGFSALARTTAFPTTGLADLILRGEVESGALTMGDAVAADLLIPEVHQVGIEVADHVPS